MLSPALQSQHELRLFVFNYWLDHDVTLTDTLWEVTVSTHSPPILAKALRVLSWGALADWSENSSNKDLPPAVRSSPDESTSCRSGVREYIRLLGEAVSASGLRPSQPEVEGGFWGMEFAHGTCQLMSQGHEPQPLGMWGPETPLPSLTVGPYLIDPLNVKSIEKQIRNDLNAAIESFQEHHGWTKSVRKPDLERQTRFLYWRRHDGLSNKLIADKEKRQSDIELDESYISRDITSLSRRIGVEFKRHNSR